MTGVALADVRVPALADAESKAVILDSDGKPSQNALWQVSYYVEGTRRLSFFGSRAGEGIGSTTP